jgi:UPF0755 protein
MAEVRVDYRRDRYGDDAEILSQRLSSSLGRASPKSPTEALQPEAIPPPPMRSQAVHHPLVVFLNFVLTVAIVGIIAIGGGVFAAKMQFDRPTALDQPRAITVDHGVSVSGIAEQLQKDGLISSKWLFVGGVLLSHQQANLKAGEYLIPAHASMRDIMDAMVTGKGILYSVSIPEGLTSQQIVDRLNSEDILVGNIAAVPPEGSLLPETYKFTRGDTRQSIIDRMERERDSVLADVWQHRAADLPIKTQEELVVLASVVEKETALADERSRVAAVFVNRLRLNMRLQSDPTVIYGLFQGAGKPAGYTLTRADVEKPTAYNTYVVNGLPPAPIANPGRASLEAVANPSRTRDLFFVADGSGGHAFAETYEAHLKNVARWRNINANSGAAIAGDAAAPDASAAPAAPAATPAATPAPAAAKPAAAAKPQAAKVPSPAAQNATTAAAPTNAPMALTPVLVDPNARDPEAAAGQ